ncbi:hypothetical protein OTU49_011561 [Cherax quadricarinatus]|uniref:RING-type domain-containing protein n=1 Tax=Cherax quadricarinatus TaxID=27406 RepID=A0AAW0W6I9_CHEQU
MSMWASLAVKYGPAILQCLPTIVNVTQGLISLWSQVKKTKEDNETVLKAMKLVKRYEDDIDKLIQDPERRQQLLEGLTILMTKIQKTESSQATYEPDTKSYKQCHEFKDESPSLRRNMVDDASSNNCFRMATTAVCCGVCRMNYNVQNRRPTLLPACGHTFCKSCISEISRRERFRCPVCRCYQDMDTQNFPDNISILQLVQEENFNKCEEENSDSVTSSLMMSYEEQILYAIRLSYKEMLHQRDIELARSLSQQQQQQQEEEERSLELARNLQSREIELAERRLTDHDLSWHQILQKESAPLFKSHNTKCVVSEAAGDDFIAHREDSYFGAQMPEDQTLSMDTPYSHDESDCYNKKTSSFTDEASPSINSQQQQEEERLSLELAKVLQEREIEWARSFIDKEKSCCWPHQEDDSKLLFNSQGRKCSVESEITGDNCAAPYSCKYEDRHFSTQKLEEDTPCMKASSTGDERCYIGEKVTSFTDETIHSIEPNLIVSGNEQMKNETIGWKYSQDEQKTPFRSRTGGSEDACMQKQEFESCKEKRNSHHWKKLKEQEDLELAFALSLSLQDHNGKENGHTSEESES